MNRPAGPGAIGLGFRRMGEHPRTCFAPAAVLCLPLALLSTASALRPSLALTAVEIVVSTLINALVAYALTLAVGSFARGVDPGPRGLLGSTFSAGLGSYLAARILFGLVLMAAVAIGMLPFLLAVLTVGPQVVGAPAPPAQPLAFLVLTLMLSLPLAFTLYVLAYLRIGLGPPANALDRIPPVRSLQRSREVTKGHRGRFFGVLVGLLGIRVAFSLLLGGPAVIVSSGAPTLEEPPGNMFSQEFLRAMLEPEPLRPAQAFVAGISTYLSAVALMVIPAVVIAELYLVLRGHGRPLPAVPPAEDPGTPSGAGAGGSEQAAEADPKSLQPPDPLA